MSEARNDHDHFRDLADMVERDPDGFRRVVRVDRKILQLRNSLGETLLQWLATEGYANAVRLLLELGADPNTIDDTGNSVLYNVVVVNQPEILQLLLRAGARPDVGSTSELVRAIYYGRNNLVSALLEHGASLSLPSLASEISHALSKCPKAKRAEIMSTLEKHGWSASP